MSKKDVIKKKNKQKQRRQKSRRADTVDTTSNYLSPPWQDFYRLVIEKIN